MRFGGPVVILRQIGAQIGRGPITPQLLARMQLFSRDTGPGQAGGGGLGTPYLEGPESRRGAPPLFGTRGGPVSRGLRLGGSPARPDSRLVAPGQAMAWV